MRHEEPLNASPSRTTIRAEWERVAGREAPPADCWCVVVVVIIANMITTHGMLSKLQRGGWWMVDGGWRGSDS